MTFYSKEKTFKKEYEVKTDNGHCEQRVFICKTSENPEKVCVQKCRNK